MHRCGRPFLLSLTAAAPPRFNSRSKHNRARFFSLKNRVVYRGGADLRSLSTRSGWRTHVPRIWSCSIDGCEKPVKRKTRDMAYIFVSRLFVVVRFPRNLWRFNTFCTVSPALHSRHASEDEAKFHPPDLP